MLDVLALDIQGARKARKRLAPVQAIETETEGARLITNRDRKARLDLKAMIGSFKHHMSQDIKYSV